MDGTTILELLILGGIAILLALILGPMFYLGVKIDEFRKEVRELVNEIKSENKDFHGRLCALEERSRFNANAGRHTPPPSSTD
jgi:hypothetical protein